MRSGQTSNALSARLVAVVLLASLILPAVSSAGVKVREEQIVLPTYVAGDPEVNPMFYFGRASQGAEGRIYPYPLYDTLTGKKEDRSYRIVYLENEYVRIGILPDIGGRIFEAVDKTNNYDFFYRQHVIKPALIGLIGAWISGGVEWNIPHHHRASTFIPVQYRIEDNDDGSKTVWVGELELRHRMRWAVGYTLHPDKSYLVASLRIVNRTPVVNTLLCFANVAVHVNENYQVIFPPRTQYVTHHHKREFTTWPIATGRYGGYNFGYGSDASWFKNHIAANSMFAWNYEDDFLAGYDHGKQAGTMSVADHHIVPGKKLWTWGNGPRAQMWDKILTDTDGPYMELMVGAYSDNQPDYSWLQPNETKSFNIYWYPFRDIGGVKNANLHAAVNLDVDKNANAKLGFYTTAAHRSAVATLKAGDRVLLQEKIAINPAKPYSKQINLPAGVSAYDLRASLTVDGQELIAYAPVRLDPEPKPKAVEPPPSPEKIQTNEELYLAGLRIEQFHNPTLDPDPYWQEALKRDPGDVRVNVALGINYLKRARYADAEKLFRKALERLTDRYTTPKDGEAFYYLGLALRAQGKLDEAFNHFYKATWGAAWRDPAYLALAEIACQRGEFASALELVDRSLDANALSLRALTLKAALLRHLDRKKEALDVLDLAERRVDPLDARIMAERWLASKRRNALKTLVTTFREHPATAIETAAEYANAGLWQDGADVLAQYIAAAPDKAKVTPMAWYYLGYFAQKLGHTQEASEYYASAAQAAPDTLFPFQSEAIDVLQAAMIANPKDARAPYHLGNLLFDWQPDAAMKLWEQSAMLDPAFPIVHRNLALAFSHQDKPESLDRAIACLERAVAAPRPHAVHFFELDQLYEAAAASPAKRLALLEKHQSIVLQRDDATARAVSLKVFAGKYDEAIELMKSRTFNIWEGGARFNIVDCWTDAHLLRAQRHLAAKRPREALADVQRALNFPDNLRDEPKEDAAGRQPEVAYWLGIVYESLGEMDNARQAFTRSSADIPSNRRGENLLSERGVQRYYQALSLRKLGQNDRAQALFNDLLAAATGALRNQSSADDFFSSFGERQSRRSRAATIHYLAGLGYLGLNDTARARREFTQTLQLSPDHLAAKTALDQLE